MTISARTEPLVPIMLVMLVRSGDYGGGTTSSVPFFERISGFPGGIRWVSAQCSSGAGGVVALGSSSFWAIILGFGQAASCLF